MIDSGIILFIAVIAIFSLFKGMVKEIFSLIAIFAGYFFAGKFSKILAVYFTSFIQNSVLAESISFLIVFFVVLIIVKIIGSIIKKFLKVSKTLTVADRFVGGVIGVIKGGIIVSIVMIPIGFIPKLKTKVLNESKVAPFFIMSSKILARQLTDRNVLKGSSKKVKTLMKTIETQLGSSITGKLGNLEGLNLEGIDIENLDMNKLDINKVIKGLNIENLDMSNLDLNKTINGLDLNNLPESKTDLSKEDQENLERLLKQFSK